jgi:hypothetical protein
MKRKRGGTEVMGSDEFLPRNCSQQRSFTEDKEKNKKEMEARTGRGHEKEEGVPL